jgi:putative ABC transport system permease protein
LGANVAKLLFPEGGNILGESIRAGGKQLKVIGILEKQGGTLEGTSSDDKVFVPYLFIKQRFNDTDDDVDNVIAIRARTREDLDLLESEVVGLMRSSRGLRPRQEDDFSINKPEQMMKEFDKLVGIFRIG